ncbi:hypothetical protein D3C86_1685000 [compost metagenome]
MLGLCDVGRPCVLAFAQRRIGLRQPRALRGQVTLQLDALPGAVLVRMTGHETLLGKLLEIGLSLLGNRHRRLQLGDHLANRGDLGLPTSDLSGCLGQLGRDVAPLVAQLRLRGIRIDCRPSRGDIFV